MAKNRTDDIRSVMLETAKVQLATLNAGIEFWSGWVTNASQFAQAANKELAGLTARGTNADEVLSRITDSSRQYLEAMTALPEKAAARFKKDLSASREKGGEPRRRAHAKT